MTANKILLIKKYARVIAELSVMLNITYEKSMDMFYNSITYIEISNGISDMHCRSDQYLADEIILEYDEKQHPQT